MLLIGLLLPVLAGMSSSGWRKRRERDAEG
ncbi:PTPA-CTERM sorting domain-containing protein [Actinopolymorpha pittospori]